MKQFGKKIKEKRNELELTQTEVGEEINVSRQTISNWENGKSYPDIPTLVTLSDFYNLSLDYLLKEDSAYMSKLKKDSTLLKILRIVFMVQIIVAISVGTHALIFSGSALIGMLSSLAIYIVTFGLILLVKRKYNNDDDAKKADGRNNMFEKGSKLNRFLLIVAGVAFLLNIFISTLNFAEHGDIRSLASIIISTIALFVIWTRSQKQKKERKKKN